MVVLICFVNNKNSKHDKFYEITYILVLFGLTELHIYYINIYLVV